MSEITARFEAAVQTLVGDGPIKQRLVRAYVDNLQELAEITLPQDAGNVFRGLNDALSIEAPAGTATPVQASVQKMSVAEAAAHAQTIVELYGLMLVAGRRADHLKIVEPSPGEAEPPQFLVGAT